MDEPTRDFGVTGELASQAAWYSLCPPQRWYYVSTRLQVEIIINYVILREADIIPEERILILSEEYELSKSYIKDIVQGKTKRKKKLG